MQRTSRDCHDVIMKLKRSSRLDVVILRLEVCEQTLGHIVDRTRLRHVCERAHRLDIGSQPLGLQSKDGRFCGRREGERWLRVSMMNLRSRPGSTDHETTRTGGERRAWARLSRLLARPNSSTGSHFLCHLAPQPLTVTSLIC